ncbi:hypothetical protein D8Y22_08635 [Salinadaptatus halalkaliphilus]|uniref:Transmembrane glycoprotein / HTH domain protein n=1 Tax=Salinadaptatus halalkaliphilus TaxID=2419781 RepID=A0A4S3TNN2_9EURY|nr:hypothetical protein [Salinadaptatus halalkaliphilus]THE65260.1 hypothetical protein D8Y22_08635 [Salinadaptatus halalkaliphilus]
MRVSTAVTLALTILLVASLLGVAGMVSATPPDAGPEPQISDQPTSTASASTVDAHATQSSDTATGSPLEPADPGQIIRINVSETGDAHWSVETRFRITDDEDEALFDEYATDVVTGDRDVEYDRATFEAIVDLASQSTDREMAVENAGWDDPEIVEPAEDVEYEDDVRIGVISYSFTWTNFATVDDQRIHVGDAFEHPDTGEMWLPTLYDDQRLVIESPPNYALETATQLSWDGPHQFESGDLEIVFVDAGSSTPTFASWWPIAGFLGLLIAVGAYAGYRILQGTSDFEQLTARLPEAVGPTDSQPNTETDPEAATDASGSRADPAPDDSATDQTGTRIEFDEEIDDDIDPELLSDEERVHRLLKQNGGRMKQANIVTETGWSNAKVSQLLSQMDDDDEIEKLRIGRENLITLPEVDPTEID